VQLAGAADGDEPDDLLAGHRVRQDAGVDHRGLDGAVAAHGADHAEAVVLRH
jgi:hypothetical protein